MSRRTRCDYNPGHPCYFEEAGIPETDYQALNGESETYLAPLYWRAMESQRSDAMIMDEKAVALIAQMDFSQVRQIRMNELLNAMRIIFTREFDRYARDFLSRHPQALSCILFAASTSASNG